MGGAYLQPLDPHSHKASSKKPGYFLSKPTCAWFVYGFLSLALLHLLCCSPTGTQRAALSPLLQYINNTYSFVSTVPGPSAPVEKRSSPVEKNEKSSPVEEKSSPVEETERSSPIEERSSPVEERSFLRSSSIEERSSPVKERSSLRSSPVEERSSPVEEAKKSSSVEERSSLVEERSCNYAVGNWVWAPGHAPRYNATECHVKESHNCIRNGRIDTKYLDWRWQPADGCPLPAFDAGAFLSTVRGKHVAFVGDSMARNQAQSLLCLLSSAFPSRLLYRDTGPGPRKHNFWRYVFPDYDVRVSFYWYPFLVRATGKAEDDREPYNHVHLDQPGDRWSADADTIDVAVLAAAHWLLNGGIYYNNSEVIGAHNAPVEMNYTGVGYAGPLHVAYRTSVERLVSTAAGRPRTVVLATFSPSHFEGKATNDPTACTNTEPYKEGERDMEWQYREVRDIVYDEANAARARIGNNSATRIEVLDVSKLASMRPDGHPGLYMHDHPFTNFKTTEGMYSDCLHFCLPGPVDTFNEILLQILRKRR